MRIVVITSCTGEKAVEHESALTLADFKQGSAHVSQREVGLQELMTPAEELYTGQQHVRLMRGVEAFRQAHAQGAKPAPLAVHVLSAGYGLVPGQQKIAPYEATFAGMKVKELRTWADSLGVPSAIRAILAQPYDLALVLLGDSYLRACDLDESVVFGGPTVAFSGSRMAKKLPSDPQLRVVPVSNPDAKRFSCGLVGLKGELAGRLLQRMSEDRTFMKKLGDLDSDEILTTLDALTPPPRAAKRRAVANPAVDFVISLPEDWGGRAKRKKIRYFIPEWDDQVDPNFNFTTETHSGGSGDWSNQVYAHQMYSEPNYDGLLVSKVVAEKGKKKAARVNDLGIHRFLRVPRSFPVMGDCGAFGYIKEKVPPYDTPEILDYYTRLDFDYGVSIDHLIVAETEEDTQYRYELTISNAEDFLLEHKAQGLEWTPIGAIQGWDASSYAAAAQQYVKMGYGYIALGGLVRTSTAKLLPILQAVGEVVPDHVDIHLFGIARENAVKELSAFGVNSVDSASVLRKAWLGSDKNYLAEGGWLPAIRIPEVNGSFRAKRLVRDGAISESDLQKLEASCLTLIRRHASSRTGPVAAELVSALTEYDTLIAGYRPSTEDKIRFVLEERPWDKCPCAICQKSGVEVIIFRGNNRNRRRGFHNTYVFHRLLDHSLNRGAGSFSLAEDASQQLALPGFFKGTGNAL